MEDYTDSLKYGDANDPKIRKRKLEGFQELMAELTRDTISQKKNNNKVLFVCNIYSFVSDLHHCATIVANIRNILPKISSHSHLSGLFRAVVATCCSEELSSR